MAENDDLKTGQIPPAESPGEAGSGSLNRRGFLKKSTLMSAPVIMTVVSGPVWARNCTMSGRLSGNLSDTGEPCAPAACSPGYWKQDQHLGSWSKIPPYTIGSSFNEAFGVAAYPIGVTLLQAIRSEVMPVYPTGACGSSSTKDKIRDALSLLAFHAVAALQNSLALGVLGYASKASVIAEFQAGFAAYNLCYKQGVVAAKNNLEAPYLNVHFCPFGNDGTLTDQNKNP